MWELLGWEGGLWLEVASCLPVLWGVEAGREILDLCFVWLTLSQWVQQAVVNLPGLQLMILYSQAYHDPRCFGWLVIMVALIVSFLNIMECKRICVLGSANADYFLYVNSIPAKGETLQAHKYLTANGGKGANQAVAAAKLNAPTTFIGQAGNDDAMHRLRTEMEKAGVELKWKVLDNEPTGMAYIYVDKEGENSIVIYGGANMAYKELEPAFKAVIEGSDYLLLQKEIPMQIVEEAAVYAHSHGKYLLRQARLSSWTAEAKTFRFLTAF